MSYPGEPSDSSGKDLSAFASTELTADDFERLATSFRPSWQLDEAPFAGPSSMTPSEIRTLQANEARAEVKALVQQSTNGSHPPPKPTVSAEPNESVIVEGGLPPAHAARPMPVPVSVSVPTPAHSPAARRVAPAIPKGRPRLASLELDGVVPSFARKSRTGLWVGLGALALVGGGIGIWLATNANQPYSAAPPSSPPVTEPSPAASAAPVVPELPTAPAPPPAPPPPAASMAAAPASAPLPMASPPITMRPAVLPTVTNTSPPAPTSTMRPSTPPPTAAKPPQPQPAPRATVRPKPTGTTIVRDVPF
jgi:hypothetical protein